MLNFYNTNMEKHKRAFDAIHFMGMVNDYNNCKKIIVPVAYEETTTGEKGTINGPENILKKSLQLEKFDIETKKEIKEDFCTLKTINNLDNVTEVVENIVKDNKFPIVLGGEHTITYSVIKGLQKAGKKAITIISLDAHADLDEGKHHGCVMRNIFNDFGCKIMVVGVRSLCKKEFEYAHKNGLKLVSSFDVLNGKETIQSLIDSIETDEVYLSVDADVLDASLVKTGTPEPFGLQLEFLKEFMLKLKKRKTLVGVDFVEEIDGFFCHLVKIINS